MVFDQAMHTSVVERLRLGTDLRRAIERREFQVHYQPIVVLGTGRIAGFEALLRWHHPVRGEILPNDFIPMAEETGLIFQLGEWVLRTACREAATWQQPLTVAVNVSARQIHSELFATTLHNILFETKLPPQNLELEITESTHSRSGACAINTSPGQGSRRPDCDPDGTVRWRSYPRQRSAPLPWREER